MSSIDQEDGIPLAQGWSLLGLDSGGREVKLVFSEDELAKTYLGLTIGRHPGLCERVVDDITVSRRHLRLGLKDGELFAEDVNALNRTLLDGQELTPFQAIVLRDGQTLTLGRVVLKIRLVAGRAPEA